MAKMTKSGLAKFIVKKMPSKKLGILVINLYYFSGSSI